jgi:hypothetical protein
MTKRWPLVWPTIGLYCGVIAKGTNRRGNQMNAPLRKISHRLITAARHIDRPLKYVALSGSHWDAVAAGRLIRTGDFLDRVGGGDLLDGQKSWFGRFTKKAYIAATGRAPLTVWTQHRTTGRFIHVCIYEPLDLALYEALRSYKGTRDLLAGSYARCA